jgi:hypothetical protein
MALFQSVAGRVNLPENPQPVGRNVIERAFSHLKDWRRVATRYDKLERNFSSTVILAILFRWWI